MKTASTLKNLTAKLLFSSLLVLFSLASGCRYYQESTHGYPCPSDSELTEHFIDQRKDFETLANMFIEDSKGKLTVGWLGKDNDYTFERIPVKRKQLYIGLMNKLDVLTVGENYSEPESVYLRITTGSKSLVDEDGYEVDSKGFLYSPKATPPRVIRFGETDFWANSEKKIDEDWYIFHQVLAGHGE